MPYIALRETTTGKFSIHEPLNGAFGNPAQSAGQGWAKLHRALSHSGFLPLRRIEFESREKRVILRGSVPTLYLKRSAQSLVRKLRTVRF